MKLLIPGLFLLVLGIGNISVGTFKGRQYQEVLDELSVLEPTPGLENASPLRRVQLAKQTETRLYQRQNKAENRLDFYQLVRFGGKVFMVIGALLTIAGLFMLWRRPTTATADIS